MMRKYLIALASVMVGTSFAQVSMPAQTVPAAPVQAAPPAMPHPPTQTPPPTTTTQPTPPNPVQIPTTQPQQTPHPPTQPSQPTIPPPAQPLTPQEMQQLNQLVPPMVGPPSNTPPVSGLPNLPGSIMSKRDRVKNYVVLQRVGNIYVVSSPGKHTYVLRSDSQILRRYRCHIVYPYTYCAKKHKKAHKPKHGLY